MSEGIIFCRVTGCNLPLNTLLSSTGRAGQVLFLFLYLRGSDLVHYFMGQSGPHLCLETRGIKQSSLENNP